MSPEAIDRKLRALKERRDTLRKQTLEQMAQRGEVDGELMRLLYEASLDYENFKKEQG